MEATQCLRDEHQTILRVLSCLEAALKEARATGTVDTALFTDFIEFFRGYADKCHHCKEEDQLFPKMEAGGIPREGGPIGVMLTEHQEGRRLVGKLDELLPEAAAGNERAFNSFIEHGTEYLNMLRNHIDKEDHCLFGMADQVVQGQQLVQLTNSYAEVEQMPDYCQRLERCKAIARDLCAKYEVPLI
ncbi:MAG: hemerythrin [Planctomycetes bacterium]|nr:hemerythrin [Planctomycetota bacterium]NOG53698.1 hemerythrin [Planctomycetota bacterium]